MPHIDYSAARRDEHSDCRTLEPANGAIGAFGAPFVVRVCVVYRNAAPDAGDEIDTVRDGGEAT